jgi:hypothetical protein
MLKIKRFPFMIINMEVVTLLAVLATSGVAHAQAGLVDQVEGLDIVENGREFEFRTLVVPAQKRFPSAMNAGVTFEYGVSERLSVGVEVEMEKSGDTLEADEIGVQAKLLVVDPDEAPIGFGLQLATGYAIEDSALALGVTAIVAIERPHWSAAVNAIVANREDDRSAFDIAYAARADRRLGDSLAIGVEAGGDLRSDARRGHYAGPVLSFEAEDGPESLPALEIGAFTGLDRDAPDIQVRIELDWEF